MLLTTGGTQINSTDTVTAAADGQVLYAHWEEIIVVEIPGLGDVEVNGSEEPEFEYDPDTGELGGVIPPAEEPEETPEIPEESLNIIEFNYGTFEANTTYTSGEYITVEYEETKTKTKYPVSYRSIVWSNWKITEDSEGNVISREPGDIAITNCDKQYSTYVVYDMTTDEAIVVDGVSGDSLMMYSIYNTEDDTLENAIYLAAYLNKNGKTTDYHVASWNGTNYVAEDCDDDISAITTFTETYIEVREETVQVKAPTVETEYVYVPVGTLKAEEGMTWSTWLVSSYNTTGETTPIIKTANFEDVDYEDEIVAGESYGVYEEVAVLTVGDYVNYPVEYENVPAFFDDDIASLTGWRVLSISEDTIRLVSAGVPLSWFSATDPEKALTTDFLSTTYLNNGFDTTKTLTEVFNNSYTQSVSSITKDDLDSAYGSTTSTGTSVTGNDLLAITCVNDEERYIKYWLATNGTFDEPGMWYLSGVTAGGVVSKGGLSGKGGVRPVVTLNSNVIFTGKDANGYWNIEIAE